MATRALGHVRLISFFGLVRAALLFFSTCKSSSNSGPSGPGKKQVDYGNKAHQFRAC